MIRQTTGLSSLKREIIQRVTELICDEYDISSDDLYSMNKAQEFSTPRMVAVGLLRNAFGFSHNTLARHYGYKHHTSVLHASRFLAQLVEDDPETAEIVKRILIEVKPLIPKPAEKNEVIVESRYGAEWIFFCEDSQWFVDLTKSYSVGYSADSDLKITAIDPDGGPYISVGAMLSDYHQDLPDTEISMISSKSDGLFQLT